MKPNFLFDGRRSFADPLVREAFDAVGCFHDAYIDTSRWQDGAIVTEICEPFFVAERAYNMFGVSGACLEVQPLDPIEAEQVSIFSRIVDRSIYELDFDLVDGVMTCSVQLIYELRFHFNPRRSWFSWK